MSLPLAHPVPPLNSQRLLLDLDASQLPRQPRRLLASPAGSTSTAHAGLRGVCVPSAAATNTNKECWWHPMATPLRAPTPPAPSVGNPRAKMHVRQQPTCAWQRRACRLRLGPAAAAAPPRRQIWPPAPPRGCGRTGHWLQTMCSPPAPPPPLRGYKHQASPCEKEGSAGFTSHS